MEKRDIMYGVLKTEKGYLATPPGNKEDFEFYIANGGFATTAGHAVSILDFYFADLFEAKGWKYRVSYGCGCMVDTGYSYGVTLEKNKERIGFQIKEDNHDPDGLDFNSVFANIMIMIAAQCENISDVERILSDYQLPIGSFNKPVDWYLQEAESGNVDVQMALARMFARGDGIKEDYAKSFEWYIKAAEAGSARSQIEVGDIYAKGKGVERNLQKALEWYTRAADAGDTGVLLKIADLHAETSVSYYYAAASAGVTKGMEKLAEHYYKSGDYVNAGTWYRKMNEHGRYNTMVGNCYYELKCYAEAIKYYNIGANNRDAEALIALGKCYYLGHGVPMDKAKADECFSAAIKAKKNKKDLTF